MKDKLYNYWWLFIFGSLFGWVVEVIFTFITMHSFQNHSAVVIGTFDMAYGLGAILLTILLRKYKNGNIFKIFIISFLGGSLLEYIMSWGQEFVFGSCAWDYSGEFLNINGRICLLYSLFWGIIGVLWIKVLYPWFMKKYKKMNKKIWGKVAIGLFIFLLFDGILTICAVERAKALNRGIAPRNGFEVFLDNTFSNDYLGNMYGAGWEKQK